VVVSPVDERQIDPRVLAERPRGIQAAEAAADHGDAVSGGRSGGHGVNDAATAGSWRLAAGPPASGPRVGAPGAQLWTFCWFVS
jgi:hypothetical protein